MHISATLDDAFLPGLPLELIRATYAEAPGNELGSGKLFSPESSAALAANTFGYFLQPDRLGLLPPLFSDDFGWPCREIQLEGVARFPWSGGRHPSLDVLIETGVALIGIESKRYEPFRSKDKGTLSGAYDRRVWGEAMYRYEAIRDQLRAGTLLFEHLDAVQLVKHAFGLRTSAIRKQLARVALLYLYAEPGTWGCGKPVLKSHIERHRYEVGRFAELVAGDEVEFRSMTYQELLSTWMHSDDQGIQMHAAAVGARFRP